MMYYTHTHTIFKRNANLAKSIGSREKKKKRKERNGNSKTQNGKLASKLAFTLEALCQRWALSAPE